MISVDKIIVRDLEIFGNHGVFQEEKVLGQKFILSLEMELDLREAAETGDLSKSVHYGEVCHKAEEVFKSKSCDLIETAAENVAQFILNEYPVVQGVKVLLKKPWAPIQRPVDYAAVEIYRKWHKAYIALGSNLGDKEKNLSDAIKMISSSSHTKVVKKSTFITTEPWGYADQDQFLNGAIEVKTLLSPKALVRYLLHVEQLLKRERIIKWGPRTLDLDVLLYDDIVSADEEIVLPHPRMHERMFVMEPLAEIAPYEVHPLLKKRMIDLKQELDKE